MTRPAISDEPDARPVLNYATCEALDDSMPPAIVRRNMICCVLMDSIWGMGWADVTMALSPLMVYLGASNRLIGLVTGAMFFAVPGVLLSPYITRRFPYKKWYFFFVNVPYLFPLAIAGIAVLVAGAMHWSSSSLLGIVAGSMMLHWFFGGFVSLPHMEYITACVPSSHRGRLAGFSYSVGSVLGMLSASLGGIILLKVAQPAAYGVLLLIAWVIMQSGYLAALFAKEQRTPVEQSPPAWSLKMMSAFWNDRNYVKFTITQLLLSLFLGTPIWSFLNVYGFRDLKMAAATSGVMLLIMQVARICSATPLGMLTDRIGAKKLYPLWMLAAAVVCLPAILLQNSWGIYASIALSAIYLSGVATSGAVLTYSLPKPEDRAGHYAILTCLGMVVMAIGPILIGILADAFSYHTIFITISIVAFVLFFVNRWLCQAFPE